MQVTLFFSWACVMDAQFYSNVRLKPDTDHWFLTPVESIKTSDEFEKFLPNLPLSLDKEIGADPGKQLLENRFACFFFVC